MSENTITLTAEQLQELRGKGQAYPKHDLAPFGLRVIRDGSGYSPLPGASNQVVLTDADIDQIETEPAGLVVADTIGQNGWLIRMEAAA